MAACRRNRARQLGSGDPQASRVHCAKLHEAGERISLSTAEVNHRGANRRSHLPPRPADPLWALSAKLPPGGRIHSNVKLAR
jgi:hypothetical protein